MLFRIFGQDYEITEEMIVECVKEMPPELPDRRHRYFVDVNNRKYPIKQLLANVTGLSHAEFTAQYAHSILSRLSFRVEEFRPPRPRVHLRSVNSPTQDVDVLTETQNLLQFAVTVETDEDGFYVSSCPALSGCHSQGRTRDEALSNIGQAIRGYLASMQKHGETLPNEKWEVVEVAL